MKFQLSDEVVETIPYTRGLVPVYHPKMCDVVISAAQAGGQEAQMCINCGICMSTFKKYQKDYPEFASAVEYAKLIFVARLEAMMVAGAQGDIEKYNFKANEKLLAVAEEKYRTLSERIQGNTTVTINTINLTSEQRLEKIKQISEKLKGFGIDYEEIPIDTAPKLLNSDVIDAE